MHRPIVWIPGVVLFAVAIAALLLQGAPREPAAERSAPVVIVRPLSSSHPTAEAARSLSASDAPEVVVLGDLAPARESRALGSARPRAATQPRAIHEIVYVDAPVDAPAPGVAEPSPLEAPAPEPVLTTAATVETAPVYDRPPSAPVPVPAPQGSSRAGAMVTGAAIGAGIGAVFGGSQGALRGAIGGAAGGAIGGRSGSILGGVLGGVGGGNRTPRRGGCYTGSSYDLVSLTPHPGVATP